MKTYNAKLKPCPFCGSKAGIKDNCLRGSSYNYQIINNGSYFIMSDWKYWVTQTVGCSKCSIHKSGDGTTGKLALKQAIKIWNTRAR